MSGKKGTVKELTRRDFMKLSAAAAAGVLLPGFSPGQAAFPEPVKRRFGKTGFNVTTLGLGGQSSIQWTPDDVDPVSIILKSFDLKVNYFDTSNVYGPSQLHFNKAFEKRNLIPGRPGYDESLRSSIFVTTKTMVRWAKGGYPDLQNVRNSTQGDRSQGAVGDLKRSISQMFGDGEGNYPEGAYVDMVMIHNLTRFEEVDVVYKGLEGGLDTNENFGALVALRDYRDGTNVTGLNPRHEKLLRHIGFSGHFSAPAMMEMIHRDTYNLLDGMLVSINVNDRKYLNMQHNVIPVAKARDIGIVGMKVFADGAMYHKEPRWSRTPEDVFRQVGTETLPSKPLIEYALTTPGVHTLITGIGHIDENPLKCQLIQNFYASQIEEDALSDRQRRDIEKLGLRAKGGETNYFQMADSGLSAPRNLRVTSDGRVRLAWDTAYAGNEPIAHYEVYQDGKLAMKIPHIPQTSLEEPFRCTLDVAGGSFTVAAVDAVGRKVESDAIEA